MLAGLDKRAKVTQLKAYKRTCSEVNLTMAHFVEDRAIQFGLLRIADVSDKTALKCTTLHLIYPLYSGERPYADQYGQPFGSWKKIIQWVDDYSDEKGPHGHVLIHVPCKPYGFTIINYRTYRQLWYKFAHCHTGCPGCLAGATSTEKLEQCRVCGGGLKIKQCESAEHYQNTIDYITGKSSCTFGKCNKCYTALFSGSMGAVYAVTQEQEAILEAEIAADIDALPISQLSTGCGPWTSPGHC